MSDEVRLTIRLPSELHQRLTELARQDRRSLNGEMIALLERATEQIERRQARQHPAQ